MRYVEPLSDARTPLADFLNILRIIVFRHRRWIALSLAVLLAFLCARALTTHDGIDRRAPLDESSLPPPYILSGEFVTARYHEYIGRLGTLHNELRMVLARDAPDLEHTLALEPPTPVPYGYQLVPRFVTVQSPPSTINHDIVISTYSWPRTETLIQEQLQSLTLLEERVQSMASRPERLRRGAYEPLVEEYVRLERAQRLIDHHIQHNRFWQHRIHVDQAHFDKQARVIEAAGDLQNINAHHTPLTPPAFLTVRHPQPHLWILSIPVYSDIQDTEFLRASKEAIETVWSVKDTEREFLVEVLIIPLTPQALYAPDAAPPTGAKIDIATHVARFPHDGGVLTTGAASTHAHPGRAIILGPQDLTTRVLAHEFGHILGFSDGYVRGYRDLDSHGFEIVEVIPDAGDIMSAPNRGEARPSHFEAIIAALRPEIAIRAPGAHRTAVFRTLVSGPRGARF